MIRIDSYKIPDDAHGLVVPAKLTKALYELVKEPEASPTIPSRTACKHNNEQTMNCSTTLDFDAVVAPWSPSHEQEHRLLQRIATSSRWPSPATEVFDGRSHIAAHGATTYDQHGDITNAATTSHSDACCSGVDV